MKSTPVPHLTSHFLNTDDGHTLHIWDYGIQNKQHPTFLFLHGGPGGGISEKQLSFFDPLKHRVILIDQRGSGLSTPFASLENNTTWHLVSDIERVREHFSIPNWHVFGGSWGSTLALTYAIRCPDRVKSLLLRGIFLCRKWEIDWLYQEGASRLFPDVFRDIYLKPLKKAEQSHCLEAYHRILNAQDSLDLEGVDDKTLEAAKCWSIWEATLSQLVPSRDMVDTYNDPKKALPFARIENHYFYNRAFFETDNWILENCEPLLRIPTRIVHGRYDVVCPVQNAFDLKNHLPHSELVVAKSSGHSPYEVEIFHTLQKFVAEVQ